MSEQVILVTEGDSAVGTMEKMEAHELGRLHRAFSVFVLNNNNELMLQRRASHKYHSGGLWTNTCCSHPRPGESNEDAAHRRLREEMGFDCALDYGFNFLYRAELDHDLIEHELDHVFIGRYNGTVALNPEEVSEARWISFAELRQQLQAAPETFTEWFKIVIDRVEAHLRQQGQLPASIKVA